MILFLSTACSVVCEDEKQAVAVKSQLQQLARPMYSNPPVHGALMVSTILSDPDLKKLWLKEVKVGCLRLSQNLMVVVKLIDFDSNLHSTLVLGAYVR